MPLLSREKEKGQVVCRSRSGISRERVEKMLDEGGKLSYGELLHCRVRYFSDGMIIGSKEFVNQVFREHRELFSEKRKDGARPMKLGEWRGLCSARALRLARVLPPGGWIRRLQPPCR